ncbi:hypothetical protein SNEBB_000624 [Seison nebaliae]|nr:hypothetical protein SNEBB_000624 [Seison nebaliae]
MGLDGAPFKVDVFQYSEKCQNLPKIENKKNQITWPAITAPIIPNVHLATYITESSKCFKKTSLGCGGQGRIFLLKARTGDRSVAKLFYEPGDLIIELNALEAFFIHPVGDWHQYRLLGASRGRIENRHVSKTLIATQNYGLTYVYPQTMVCMDITYVQGDILTNCLNYLTSLQFNNRVFYAFVILLLRQIQAVHFTLNKRPLVEVTLFNKGDYANAHGDIHHLNIMIPEKRYSQRFPYHFPILIDYGTFPRYLYDNVRDLKMGIYNIVLRQELGIKEFNVIAKKRIISSPQSSDFCSLAFIFATSFVGQVYTSDPIIVSHCRKLKVSLHELESTTARFDRVIKYVKLMNQGMFFEQLSLIELMFSSMLQFQTYETWLDIVKYFDPERNEQIPRILRNK